MENISPDSFSMAKPPAPAGRYDRVVEKPDHMPPRLADAGIGAPSLELRQDLLSSAATIFAFSLFRQIAGTRRDHDPNSEAA